MIQMTWNDHPLKRWMDTLKKKAKRESSDRRDFLKKSAASCVPDVERLVDVLKQVDEKSERPPLIHP